MQVVFTDYDLVQSLVVKSCFLVVYVNYVSLTSHVTYLVIFLVILTGAIGVVPTAWNTYSPTIT